jgi:hypothetical protein
MVRIMNSSNRDDLEIDLPNLFVAIGEAAEDRRVSPNQFWGRGTRAWRKRVFYHQVCLQCFKFFASLTFHSPPPPPIQKLGSKRLPVGAILRTEGIFLRTQGRFDATHVALNRPANGRALAGDTPGRTRIAPAELDEERCGPGLAQPELYPSRRRPP